MSADFSKLLTHLNEQAEAHADRDGLIGVRRTLFLQRGGQHFQGETCPTAPPPGPPPHQVWCLLLDDECDCYWA